MGKNIFSKEVRTPTRLYYVDVNADSKGGRYMTIREIPRLRVPDSDKSKKPQRIFIHSQAWDGLSDAIADALRYLSGSDEKK